MSAFLFTIWLRFDPDFRFFLTFLIASVISFLLGLKVWGPVVLRFPPTFGDGFFQFSDILYVIQFIVVSLLVALPWILPFKELFS